MIDALAGAAALDEIEQRAGRAFAHGLVHELLEAQNAHVLERALVVPLDVEAVQVAEKTAHPPPHEQVRLPPPHELAHEIVAGTRALERGQHRVEQVLADRLLEALVQLMRPALGRLLRAHFVHGRVEADVLAVPKHAAAVAELEHFLQLDDAAHVNARPALDTGMAEDLTRDAISKQIIIYMRQLYCVIDFDKWRNQRANEAIGSHIRYLFQLNV